MIVFLFGARGDLVSYELLDEIAQLTAQAVVNSFIPTGPDIEYDLELYSITYETIDQFGEYSEASGSVALPDNYNFAYPLYLIGHGTQIRRLSAPSMGSFNLLNQSKQSSIDFFVISPI